MRRHEIPTHLGVPDRFVLGLTALQTMQLLAAAALVVGLGLLLALARPGGRPLEAWLLLAVGYLAGPRRLVWRPCPAPSNPSAEAWTELAPRVGWLASVEARKGAEHGR